MMIFVYLLIVCSCLAAAYLLLTRTSVFISNRNGVKIARLTISGAGGEYNFASKRIAFFLGPLRYRPRKKEVTPEEIEQKKVRKAEKQRRREEKKLKKGAEEKKQKKLTWNVRVQLIKAFLLFIGRLLAAVTYDIGPIVVRPTIANPALAGMAYGWGQAFLGAMPGLRQKTVFAPNFDGSESVYEGEMTVSIKNRQFVGLLWRLIRELPIGKIVKQKFIQRGSNA
ncbi:MAG: hypothetical protein R3F48_02390 [Candidatus Zixiibacteriota bacterium]